jgi:nucleoside 2-deoxyribosyltransferase
MNDDSKLIYLASPYTGRTSENFVAVCLATAHYLKQGHHVISPIAHTHPVAMIGELPTGFDAYQKYDERLIRACDEVWVLQLKGWESSTGVQAEMEYAKSIGKPVILKSWKYQSGDMTPVKFISSGRRIANLQQQVNDLAIDIIRTDDPELEDLYYAQIRSRKKELELLTAT